MSITARGTETIVTSGWHLRLEDSIVLGSFSMLLYDHLLTFGDEVEYIWKRKKTFASLLFLMNRYFAPPAFVICIIAVFSPNWTVDVCRNFAKFEGALTIVTALVAEALLMLRVYAVYNRSKCILTLQASIWIVQLCCMSFTLCHSGPVVIPPSPVTYGCILVPDPQIGSLDILFTVPMLIFDSVTFVLLLIGLLGRIQRHSEFTLFKLILRDGFLYFVTVFLINTAWTVSGLTLMADLRVLLSFFSTAVTNVLIGRLTLNLRINSKPVDSTSSPNIGRWRRRRIPITGSHQTSSGTDTWLRGRQDIAEMGLVDIKNSSASNNDAMTGSANEGL